MTIEAIKKFNTRSRMDERTGDLVLRVDLTAFAEQSLSAESLHLARLEKFQIERECLERLHKQLTHLLYGEVQERLRELVWEIQSTPPSQVYQLAKPVLELIDSLEWKPA